MSQIHRQLVFVLLALVVNPLVGWSHPGHGTTAQSVDSLSPAHYLIEPVHALPIAVVIAIVLLAAASLGRSRLAARLTSRAR